MDTDFSYSIKHMVEYKLFKILSIIVTRTTEDVNVKRGGSGWVSDLFTSLVIITDN
jgi:hypothetical protein